MIWYAFVLLQHSNILCGIVFFSLLTSFCGSSFYPTQSVGKSSLWERNTRTTHYVGWRKHQENMSNKELCAAQNQFSTLWFGYRVFKCGESNFQHKSSGNGGFVLLKVAVRQYWHKILWCLNGAKTFQPTTENWVELTAHFSDSHIKE